MGSFQYCYLQASHGQHYYSTNMPSRKVKSSPKKKSFAKKSNKIVKKKMTAPAALIKAMNVSGPLAEIIGVKRASRPQAIKGLWAYIKKHNLQDPKQRQYFTP